MSVNTLHYAVILTWLLIKFNTEIQKDELEYILLVFSATILQLCLELIIAISCVIDFTVYYRHLFLLIVLFQRPLDLFIVYVLF